jgi:hypothetical protein
MNDEHEDIDVDIARCVTEIAALRAREDRYRAKAQGEGGNSLERTARGTARWQLQRATEQREQIEARLHALEREKESDMRNRDDVVMPTADAGWPWRVWSGQMRFGDRVFRRGAALKSSRRAASAAGRD